LQFTWHERKNSINQQKHGISFETAIRAFDDPYQVTYPERVVDGEQRWHTIGVVNGIHLLLVAHAVSVKGDDEVIRVISARKATRWERRIYAEDI